MALCHKCHGTGLKRVTESQWGNAALNIPCPACGGCGIAHCCDGDQPSARDLEEQNGKAYGTEITEPADGASRGSADANRGDEGERPVFRSVRRIRP